MSDEYVEVTRQGFFSRLISSVVGVVFGLGMFLVGFPVLWWNEGRAVKTARSLEEGAGAVVSVSAGRVDPTNDGKLVHLNGLATTSEILADPTFKVSANALRLRREVEMYQWVESSRTETRERLGGSEEKITTYTYDRQWKGSVVDSSRFKKPEGHLNPGVMRYQSSQINANNVTLGAFALNSSLRDDIRNQEPVPATEQALAAMIAATAPTQQVATPAPRKGKKGKVIRKLTAAPRSNGLKVSGDSFYLGLDPGSPVVGDVRISFTRVPPTEVSIIAQQRGAGFQPYQTKAGRALQMLSTGTISAPQMFKDAETSNMIITWLLRLGGYLLMAFGGYSVLRPLAVTASVIPFLGAVARTGLGLVASLVAAPFAFLTIAIAWIVYRPLLGALLLVGTVGTLFLLRKLVRSLRTTAAPVRLAAVG